MTLDRKKIMWCIAVVVIAIAIYYFFFKKKPETKSSENSYNGGGSNGNTNTETKTNKVGMELPDYFQLQYKISTQGKKSVFPMMLEKITEDPIELPNRRSLLSKNVTYKFVDIMPGDQIKIVSLQRLNYTIEDNAFSDDFLVTDKDYVIAYSQAKEHFMIVGK